MNFQKNAKESLKVWLAYLAIRFVVKNHFFKNAIKAVQQKVTLFLQVLFTKVKHTSRYDFTVHKRYDVTALVSSYKYRLEPLA